MLKTEPPFFNFPDSVPQDTRDKMDALVKHGREEANGAIERGLVTPYYAQSVAVAAMQAKIVDEGIVDENGVPFIAYFDQDNGYATIFRGPDSGPDGVRGFSHTRALQVLLDSIEASRNSPFEKAL